MAKRSKGMTEAELAGLVRRQVQDSVTYDKNEWDERQRTALEYYAGRMPDLPAMAGRSKVTSRDLSDAIGWILPGCMRVFANSDTIVVYEPQQPNDEPFAKQATDYVNYIFVRECQGYRVLRDGIHEGLLFGNGVVKFWWDSSKEYETLDYSCLDEMAYTMLVADDEVEVLQHSVEEKVEKAKDPQTGQMVEQINVMHDVKIKRTTSYGRLKICCIPPEEFLIERGAKSIEDARFTCHRSMRTRQSLIDDGYDRKTVMEIGSSNDLMSNGVRLARWNRTTFDRNNETSDPLIEEVEVFEAYTRCDFDGDGYAEMRKVVLAGTGSDRAVLSNDEWSDDVPFADLVPMPEPHRWQGRSLFDELEDIMRVKTTLLRQTLDNLYLANVPQREAMANQVENPDELANPTFGGTVWVKQLNATREISIPFFAEKSYSMLEYQDSMAERRTGVSRQSMALDPDALQNQTAAGQMMAQSAAYAKVELYARNMAELGLKRLFRCLLKLVVRHQDKPKMIRLRDQWVEMDPRSWNANMDANVSVGLGSGSRDRDAMLLLQIAGKQEQIIAQSGPANPLASLVQYSNTLRKLVETSGIRNPDEFFSEVNDQTLQQLQQQQGQKPDPEAQKAQAQVQIEQQKAQSQMQLEQQKAAAGIETQRQKNALEMQATREKGAAELQIAREKAEFERQQKRENALLDAQLRREEMQLEAALTQEANRLNAAVAAKAADTNLNNRKVSQE